MMALREDADTSVGDWGGQGPLSDYYRFGAPFLSFVCFNKTYNSCRVV